MNEINLHCPSCQRDIPLPPHKCPHCGANMVPLKARRSMNPLLVIFLLFFVLGPFALGFLWRNDRFTRPAKWALTVIVAIYTVVMVWYTYVAIQAISAGIDQAMGQLQF